MPLTKKSTRLVARLGVTSTGTEPETVAPAAGDTNATVYGAGDEAGDGERLGDGLALGEGLGLGEGLALGVGVALGEGLAVGVGLAVGSGFLTVTFRSASATLPSAEYACT
jgi:hypothetical protein